MRRNKTLFEKAEIRENRAEQKGRVECTVIIVRFEEYRKNVSSRLSSDYFDSFQIFVFVEIESINRRILELNVIEDP